MCERAGRGVLEVEDTGTGIAASELPRLFERFYRVRDARSRTHEGTGLGLSLVRELVKLQGGSVHVESTEGRGTKFTVELPFGGVAGASAPSGASRREEATGAEAYLQEALRWMVEDAPKSGVAVGQGRGLLAEDNADMRDDVRRVLSPAFEVEAVADGQAALARPPDLVLSDVMMPRLDGVGLLRALRAAPHTRDLPILLLSARAGEEATVEGPEDTARRLPAPAGCH